MNDGIFKKLERIAKTDIADSGWLSKTRQLLLAYIHTHPIAPKSTGIRWYYMLRFAPGFAIITLIILTSGITLAAQASIPGELLYPWKVGVESIESAFVVGAQNRAEFEVERTVKRLHEVTELAVRKEINPDVVSEAHVRLAEQIKTTEEEISKAAFEDNGKALAVAVELSATLEAHKSVLTSLGEKVDVTVKEQVETALSTIEKNTEGIEDTIETLKDQDTTDEIHEKLIEAQKKIDDVLGLVIALDDTDELRWDAEATLLLAQQALNNAEEAINQDNFDIALTEIQSALKIGADTVALLEATKNSGSTVTEILVTPTPTPSSSPTITTTPTVLPTVIPIVIPTVIASPSITPTTDSVLSEE